LGTDEAERKRQAAEAKEEEKRLATLNAKLIAEFNAVS